PVIWSTSNFRLQESNAPPAEFAAAVAIVTALNSSPHWQIAQPWARKAGDNSTLGSWLIRYMRLPSSRYPQRPGSINLSEKIRPLREAAARLAAEGIDMVNAAKASGVRLPDEMYTDLREQFKVG